MMRGKIIRDHGVSGRDAWEARLSEYLDEELPPRERARLEAHLRDCASCAEALAGLRAVVAQAAGCPREALPSTDLWAGIAPRLRPRDKPSPWAVGPRNWVRGWVLGGPRNSVRDWVFGGRRDRVFALAAAALVVLAAAIAVWHLAGGAFDPGTRVPAGRGEAAASAPAGPAAPPAPAGKTLEASREYYDQVAHLRRVAGQRLAHDPRVVEVLDENLAALDAAIAGYRDALAADPQDATLRRRLEQARDRKVEVLQQAAALSSEANN